MHMISTDSIYGILTFLFSKLYKVVSKLQHGFFLKHFCSVNPYFILSSSYVTRTPFIIIEIKNKLNVSIENQKRNVLKRQLSG